MNNPFVENENNKPLTNKIRETKNKTVQLAKNSLNAAKELGQKSSNVVKSEIKKASNSIKTAANTSQTYQAIKRGNNRVALFAQDFAEKNTTISKFVFILFIVIIFGLLIRVGVYIISLFTTPSKNPIIVNGLLSTNSLTKYQVNPSVTDSKPILRSVNESQGMEFTWSTWVFIDNANSGNNENPKRIFSKGGDSETGKPFAMNSPGLYLYDGKKSNTNALTVAITTYNDDTMSMSTSGNIEKIIIKNVPIQKWVNIIIRVQNRTIDIYVNGIMSSRYNLTHVIKQNYGDIFVGDNANGMNGFISSLRYFDHGIGNMKIEEIIQQGPNLKAIGGQNQETMPPYLATRWYLDNV